MSAEVEALRVALEDCREAASWFDVLFEAPLAVLGLLFVLAVACWFLRGMEDGPAFGLMFVLGAAVLGSTVYAGAMGARRAVVPAEVVARLGELEPAVREELLHAAGAEALTCGDVEQTLQWAELWLKARKERAEQGFDVLVVGGGEAEQGFDVLVVGGGEGAAETTEAGR